VNEFDSISLRCKVKSEPNKSQITWRREDGASLDGLEQRFQHQYDRASVVAEQNGQLAQKSNVSVASIDSSELIISTIRRQQAGPYLVSILPLQFSCGLFALSESDQTINGHQFPCPFHLMLSSFCPSPQCIASNGVHPGISQRIVVTVTNCRQSAEVDSLREPCSKQEEEALTTTTVAYLAIPNQIRRQTEVARQQKNASAAGQRETLRKQWNFGLWKANSNSNGDQNKQLPSHQSNPTDGGTSDKGRQSGAGPINTSGKYQTWGIILTLDAM